MKITKRQLRRIIKEEKAKLQEAYEYNPVDEMYGLLDDLTKAQRVAGELADYGERDPTYSEHTLPFDAFSQQLKKLIQAVGVQADKAYKQTASGQEA